MLAYSLHACVLIIALASLHLHTYTCMLCTWMLSLFHLHWGTYSVHVVVQVWWKCQCVSVSVEVSVFKGFSGRTLRNAFGDKKGKANMTEDPSATSTTADNTSWQGDDASGIGTEDLGYCGEDWYQSGWHDSFTSYCVEHIEWSDKNDRQDDISHAHENATTELTVNDMLSAPAQKERTTKQSRT